MAYSLSQALVVKEFPWKFEMFISGVHKTEWHKEMGVDWYF